MIAASDIGVVVQGDLRPTTLGVLRQARRLFPDAQIVFSTFEGSSESPGREIAGLTDAIIVNRDPGPLPPTVNSLTAGANNINRQLVSTQAGLAALRTPYALKLRSDAWLGARAIVDLWDDLRRDDPRPARLAAASCYTRHPRGPSGYLFHVSDWVAFGEIATLRGYWSAPPMSTADALWFEDRPHGPASTATARRFRARFTPEQWICTHYAHALGYDVPDCLDQRAPDLVDSYERFLARHCLILDCSQIALRVAGHVQAERSWFQRLDCLAWRDWRALWIADLSGRAPSTDMVRAAARAARRPLAHAILARKWLAGRGVSPRRTHQPPPDFEATSC